jgi:hypothetical protein
MEIHPLVFIGSVVIPLSIIAGIIIWTFLLRKRSLKNQKELTDERLKSDLKETEIKLWEKLVSSKEKHIDILHKKIDRD